VEVVAQAEAMELGGGVGRTGVEQAVGDVDGPGYERKEDGDPCGKRDVGSPGKGEGPDDGYGGSVEAGEVPEGEWFWRVEDWTGAFTERVVLPTRCAGGCRIGWRSLQCFDCRRFGGRTWLGEASYVTLPTLRLVAWRRFLASSSHLRTGCMNAARRKKEHPSGAKQVAEKLQFRSIFQKDIPRRLKPASIPKRLRHD
jgi:hypothetical protein